MSLVNCCTQHPQIRAIWCWEIIISLLRDFNATLSFHRSIFTEIKKRHYNNVLLQYYNNTKMLRIWNRSRHLRKTVYYMFCNYTVSFNQNKDICENSIEEGYFPNFLLGGHLSRSYQNEKLICLEYIETDQIMRMKQTAFFIHHHTLSVYETNETCVKKKVRYQ